MGVNSRIYKNRTCFKAFLSAWGPERAGLARLRTAATPKGMTSFLVHSLARVMLDTDVGYMPNG